MKMIRSLILLIFCLFSGSGIYAQCFCADMKFKVYLPQTTKGYGFRIVQAPKFVFRTGTDTFYTERKGDTVAFQFGTGGGIDTLVFAIENKQTKKTMHISVLNMHYDIPYFIALPKFAEGQYVFDWEKIDRCQQANRKTILVNCEGLKFYQLQLVDETSKSWPQSFVHNSIKPYDLSYFLSRNQK